VTAVQASAVPREAPSEGSTYVWLPTAEIGGDSVYGLRGQVTSAEDSSKVIGKSAPGGVVVEVRAKEGAGCRGDMGDHRPQALWVFSADAECTASSVARSGLRVGRIPQGRFYWLPTTTN